MTYTVNELRRMGILACSWCRGSGEAGRMDGGPCTACGGRRYRPREGLSIAEARRLAAIIDTLQPREAS